MVGDAVTAKTVTARTVTATAVTATTVTALPFFMVMFQLGTGVMARNSNG